MESDRSQSKEKTREQILIDSKWMWTQQVMLVRYPSCSVVLSGSPQDESERLIMSTGSGDRSIPPYAVTPFPKLITPILWWK